VKKGVARSEQIIMHCMLQFTRYNGKLTLLKIKYEQQDGAEKNDFVKFNT